MNIYVSYDFKVEDKNCLQVQHGKSTTAGGYHCCSASAIQKSKFCSSVAVIVDKHNY